MKLSNKEISEIIDFTGKLLTLHGEDETRAKIYGGLAFNLDRQEQELSSLSELELQGLRGIGKSMSLTIREIVETGTTDELQRLLKLTPEGVLDLFKVKGIGVKKIQLLWKDKGIENLNDLQIACEEGSIAKTKGFGLKTQDKILESLLFIKEQIGKLRMNLAFELSELIEKVLLETFEKVISVGGIPRRLETIDKLSFLVQGGFEDKFLLNELFLEDLKESTPFIWRGRFDENEILVEISFLENEKIIQEELIANSSEAHLKHNSEELGMSFYHYIQSNIFDNSEAYYGGFGSKYIVPEMREGLDEFEWIKHHENDELITWGDLKGSVHNHSKYSDGKNSLLEMAEACKNLGLSYFGIADHSQTAVYASGLIAGKVIQQQKEIDSLNQKMAPFKILKGIESDILNDGSLDYENDILSTFDYIVASVHSNLDMNIEKATDRLIKAIENPFTSILGHPTGRLLLIRKGYPLDFKKIIDACAANKVIMEINANPYRLDIDWRWIPYCLEKGVVMSINPDAHKIIGFQDMRYGIDVARKAGLTKEMTFNAWPLEKVQAYLANKKN